MESLSFTSFVKSMVVVGLVAGAATVLASGPSSPPRTTGSTPKLTTTPSGLKFVDLEVGSGAELKKGMRVLVDYEAWLADGTKFDSSYDRREPFSFKIGDGQVIQGWEEGVIGMRVGGKRKLVIPPDLGYGATGAPPRIPANATLTFEVKALAAQ
jgi:FKBP-type peptidyl-prolyl cis-trans isomerase